MINVIAPRATAHRPARRWSRLGQGLARQLFGRHAPCPRCHARVRLTGAPPATPAEDLVKRLLGDRPSIDWHTLEEELAEALYREELRSGGWALDIGIWGASAFRSEATGIIAGVRPEFSVLEFVAQAAGPDSSAGGSPIPPEGAW